MDLVKHKLAFLVLAATLLGGNLTAQEVLLPLQHTASVPIPKTTTDSAVLLPFFDDFSQPTDRLQSTLWEPCGATVGTGYGELPPTIGMATLDAIDADGNLYSQATTSTFPADTLLSRPIRLDSLKPADSLVLSFFYLPGGGYGNLWERVGDTPDPADSLYLDLYNPADSEWHTVWSRGGISVDTLMAQTGKTWQYVAISINDRQYFDSSFRFRFRNHASLDATSKRGMKGNCDQWNIDYLLLDTARSVLAAPSWRDVAFAADAPSLLSAYQAMPARQFRTSDMAQNIEITIANLYNSELATQYAYFILDEQGDTVHRYDGGFENAPASGYQTAAAHTRPPVAYAFPESDVQHTYDILHVVREGAYGDSRQQNDTVRFSQLFADYYAYDDGAPENGYGLTSTASRVYLAYRFDLNQEDTLSAIDLYFNRTKDGENENVMFYLTVWQAGEDGRPGEVLYRDTERRRPLFGGMNLLQRYALEQPTVVGGSIFVGFEQVGNDFINLGFDRNHQSANRIWYLTSTEWQQSILRGSLMMRPVFGSAAVTAIDRPLLTADSPRLYPNPTTDMVQISGIPEGSRIELYNTYGQLALSTTNHQLSTTNYQLPTGFYLVRIMAPDGSTFTTKLIIKR